MKTTFILPLLLFSTAVLAQSANDCSNAVVVCGNSVITSNASGFGTQKLDSGINPCAFEEVNSIWLQLNIDQTGLLEFLLTPDDPDIEVDYDFYIFGPDFNCGNFDAPVRCSTTNPNQAGISSNVTGLRAGSTDESEGPGPEGDSFVAPLQVFAGETYFLLIDRPEGDGGFSLDWEGSSDFVDPPPILVDEPDVIETCFADFGLPIDLTQNENQIAIDPGIFFEYFASRADAFDGNRQITDPTAFTTNAFSTIFVKATSGNSCFEILEQEIEVARPFSETLEFNTCDPYNVGRETFALGDIYEVIEGGLQNSAIYTVSLHSTENDADTDQEELTADYESGGGLIYARIETNADVDCFLTVPITLTVLSDDPDLPNEYLQCDLDLTDSEDGITTFDLQEIFNGLTQGKANEYMLYESELLRDSDTEISSISEFRNATPFAQTIYYTLVSDQCESFGEIELRVESTIITLNERSPLIACDIDPATTILEASFDLDVFVQDAFPTTSVTIYPTLEDTFAGQNRLSGTISSENTSVFIRIDNGDRCPTVEELLLMVNPSPEIALEKEYRLCTENPALNIEAPEGFESYSWAKVGETASEEIGITTNVTLTESGTYRLTVTESYEVEGQTITCSGQADFEVLPTEPPVIDEVVLGGSSANNILDVRVIGNGDYEYSLDNVTFFDSNIIENVPAGSATVYVRNTTGCGEDQVTISVFGYPKFFTPNGDSVNDQWQIIGADPQSSTTATISVFDRYGKFLGQFDPLGPGWDGTYNNEPLPESDYWFKAVVSGQKEIHRHFTLKR
ncbi:MAG: T9SS type B sorting domain-containing protein [Pricia sp.]